MITLIPCVQKAKRILGLLYWRHYNLVDDATIKQLYSALVRLHMEYACVVWDPYTHKNIKSLGPGFCVQIGIATMGCWI